MQSDPSLAGVGAIVIDEVHERDIYTARRPGPSN